MPAVEPVPGAPAATLSLPGERALAVADYHAGIEAALRYERGVELDSNAAERRDRLLGLVDRTDADRVVVVGDLVHRIATPAGADREEVEALLDALDVPLTLVKGNHDGGVAEAFGERVEVTPGDGVRWGAVAAVHGHTWPRESVLGADVVCMGHEHPAVKLEDEVGGSRVEPAWLRGPMAPEPFAASLGVDPADLTWGDPELVVFPAFNDRSGGTWVNVESQEFLAPFLPEGLADGDCYLLDGTRLGPYREI